MIIYSADTITAKECTLPIDCIQDVKITPRGVVFLLLKQKMRGFPSRIVRIDDQKEAQEIQEYYNLQFIKSSI